MKRFIKYTFTFLIPILLIAVCLEFTARSIPNPYKYKYEWMQEHAKDVQTLILGSSHSYYGIRPEFLSGTAFNLANVAQDIKLDKYLLEYWADKYMKLTTVIYPISYFTWSYSGLEDNRENYRCRYYRIYMDCDLYSPFSKNNFELSDLTAARSKIKRGLRNLRNKNMSIGCDQLGWGDDYTLDRKNQHQWNDNKSTIDVIDIHTNDDEELINSNLMMTKEIADFCRDHNIRLILVTIPCWHSYNDKLDKNQINTMYQLIHQLQQEYGLIYLDYMRDERFEADDFYDSNHLSDQGATKFSKILDEGIKTATTQSLH